MKIISEKQVLIVKIEYRIDKNECRADVWSLLDQKYGESNWRSLRSGPMSGSYGMVGLVVAEVDINRDD